MQREEDEEEEREVKHSSPPAVWKQLLQNSLWLFLTTHSLVVPLKTTHPIYTYLFVCVVWWWCWCEETVWWVLAKQPAARLVLYYLRLFKKLFKSRFSNFIAHFRRVNISSSLHATTRTLLQLLTLFRGDWIFHFFTEKCIKTSLPFHHKITWCKFSMFFLSQADFLKILEKKQGIHFLVLFLEQIHSMQFFYCKKNQNDLWWVK